MHILYVLDTWGLVGGTERHAMVVIPALLERGHRITVLCREDRRPGVDAVDVIEYEPLGRADLTPPQQQDLALRLRGADADVVLVAILHNSDAYGVLLDAAPVVRFVHDHRLYCPGMNKYLEDGNVCRRPLGLACLTQYWFRGGCTGFKKIMHQRRVRESIRTVRDQLREVALVRRSAAVVTNSEYMRRELIAVGFPSDRTTALTLFTASNTDEQPPEALDDDTRAFLDAGDEPLLFTPARLTLPDKGVDFLLTALAQVRSPFRAVISGEGPHREWLEEKRHEDRVADRVHFSGWVSSGAVETLYARAAAVVCPSVWAEPFGLVGLEAGAHGKPVVAFAVGGIPEWLTDGENGFLVPRKDTRAMAAAIDRLLTDPAGARRMGEAGRRMVVERFPRAKHIDELERVLLAAAR